MAGFNSIVRGKTRVLVVEAKGRVMMNVSAKALLLLPQQVIINKGQDKVEI